MGAIEDAMSDLQTGHVNMWIANEALRSLGDFSAEPNEVETLRHMIAALYEEIDVLGAEQDEKERLQALLDERKQHFDLLQAELAVSWRLAPPWVFFLHNLSL